METDQNDLAAKFLLGKLSDDEQADVEKEYFHNTSSFETILIAENTLTDAYVSDRLSSEDRILFEQRLLINPRQKQRAAFAETLVSYASRLSVEDLVTGRADTRWSRLFTGLFSGQTLLSYAAAAAVLVLLVAGALWWTLKDSNGLSNENLAKIEIPLANVPGEELPAKDPDTTAPLEVQTPISEPKSKTTLPSPKKEVAEQKSQASIISTIILTRILHEQVVIRWFLGGFLLF